MSDKVNALMVVLKKAIRREDIENLIIALKQFSIVADVKLNIVDTRHYVAKVQVVSDLREKFLEFFEKELSI